MIADLTGWGIAAVSVTVTAALALRRRRLDARLQLIALASHELRGALGAMALALARADAPPLSPRAWRDSVEALRFQQARAVLAADDLDSARGARSTARTEVRSAIDLEALVRSCVRSWAAAHGRWRLVLEWRAARVVVDGHAGRLSQALDNLVANALEHGGGPVTLLGRLAGDFVTVSVLDRGPGVRRSLTDVRAVSWRARRGHGLAIARRAVEEHGGRMRLVRDHRGAGVEISLPISPEAPSTAGSGTALPAPGPPGLARSG